VTKFITYRENNVKAIRIGIEGAFQRWFTHWLIMKTIMFCIPQY